ncbi:AraC family transcriptional regulator [uncultured Desulfobacter sp.]|uniref:helix-turn-helix transcriptional regulator n=1 Tax=uncultured Desulfobacter sp. TaxID=240139 RepID=UPI002AA847F3|nr:AraC family transcriptional regulator [uncultured Desulfobacter sp.]
MMSIYIYMQEITDGSFCWEHGQLQSLKVSPRYGLGNLAEVRSFKNGVSIVFQDFSIFGDKKIRLTNEEDKRPPLIGFTTCLSGVRHIFYDSPRIPMGDGLSAIEFDGHKESALFMEVTPNTPIRILTVCVDTVAFEALTGKRSKDLVESLDLLDRKTDKQSNPKQAQYIDFSQRTCAYQAFTSFRNNPDDTLFLEAKALELVALQLNQLALLTGKAPRPRAGDHHMEKIIHAGEILKQEMAEPPGARDLAYRVGLNHNQLVHGFREVFGTGPFEYLRAIRLQKARTLIAGHECNVTQAAAGVGYSSLSHFSKAFKETFGINPKAFAKKGKGARRNFPDLLTEE